MNNLVTQETLKMSVNKMNEKVAKIHTRPVSISQFRSYLSCQRKWAFSRLFPMDIVKPHFTVGRAVHSGLEILSESQGNLEASLAEAKTILDSESNGMWAAEYPLVECMIKGYKAFDEKNKDYEIIANELEFEVLLNNMPLEELDAMTEEEIEALELSKGKGFIDFLAVTTRELVTSDGTSIPVGTMIAGEYKTAKAKGNIDYDLDNQCTLYLGALSKLLGTSINFMVYNTLYKKMPKQPTVLKDGGISAAACVTTYGIYKEALVKAYGSVEAAPDKCQTRLETLVHSDSTFFERTYTWRTDTEIATLEEEMANVIPRLNEDYKIAKTYMDVTHLSCNPGRDCKNMCDHRELCIKANRGQKLELADAFKPTIKIGGTK